MFRVNTTPKSSNRVHNQEEWKPMAISTANTVDTAVSIKKSIKLNNLL